MNDAAFPDMHDWTLSGVDLDWADAVAKLRFSSVGGGQPTLTLSNVIDLHVPKHQSWGPSVSVNRAEWLAGMGDAIQTLRIEMQSGDVITVDASALIWNERRLHVKSSPKADCRKTTNSRQTASRIPTPFVLNEVERRAGNAAPASRASTSLSANGDWSACPWRHPNIVGPDYVGGGTTGGIESLANGTHPCHVNKLG